MTATVRREGAYRWYVTAVLALVLAFNVMDRHLIALLQEQIKAELLLDDLQLGLLTGLSFAVFYGTLALPLARLADRHNRMRLLSMCLFLWSAMTMACGMAVGFVSLMLARIGVGVGEAGGYPTSASVLSDYFPKERRGTALAIFGLGAPLGASAGLFLGGYLSDLVGWRNTFLIIGLAGVLMAPLVLLTIREPKRGAGESHRAGVDLEAAPPPFLDTMKHLWRIRSIRYLFTANIFHGIVLYSYVAWSPSFYIRVFDVSTTDVSVWLGLLSLGTAAGTSVGGVLYDWAGRRDIRWQLWLLACNGVVLAPLLICQFLAPSLVASLAFAVVPAVLIQVFVGPTIALAQSLVQPRIRAMTAAISLFTLNVFGLGLGPTITGALSDALGAHLADPDAGLRYAVTAVLAVEFVAIGFYALGGRHLKRDSERDRALDFASR